VVRDRTESSGLVSSPRSIISTTRHQHPGPSHQCRRHSHAHRLQPLAKHVRPLMATVSPRCGPPPGSRIIHSANARRTGDSSTSTRVQVHQRVSHVLDSTGGCAAGWNKQGAGCNTGLEQVPLWPYLPIQFPPGRRRRLPKNESSIAVELTLSP
jgi:hypothetical protein